MKTRDTFTRILATAGTVLTAVPLLLPLIFGLTRVLSGRRFMVDFLMPAELFLVVLAGGAMLVWASARARSRINWMTWSLSVAVCSLALSMGLAVITGLSSGEIEPQGAAWGVTLAALVVYLLAVLSLAVNGALLAREVFRGGEA